MEALIKLDSTHREQLAAHLLALNRDDRADRFMGIVSDDYVQRYIAGIGYACDVLIGALQGRRVVALAHAAVYLESGELLSEVGVSVDKELRRKGLGKRLLRAAIAAAKRFNVRRVHVIFRSDNVAMTALTRAMGARIDRQGTESSAVFETNGGPHLRGACVKLPDSQGIPTTTVRPFRACVSPLLVAQFSQQGSGLGPGTRDRRCQTSGEYRANRDGKAGHRLLEWQDSDFVIPEEEKASLTP